ncbi:MAG: hypothetical protein AUJ97_00725 [Bacteroidetes bacterium CG2_30_32_10]|nr:MAG: hypothetical protein AUJ97_00725 [Bacteroidetes bacterium CG2_30_32_10]
MKSIILKFAVLLVWWGGILHYNLAFSQKVFSCDSKYDAKIKVFVVDSKYDADLLVYKVSSQYDVTQNEGLWFFTESKYDADKLIYFVDSKYDADLLIYFVDSKYDAKWEKVAKKYLLY